MWFRSIIAGLTLGLFKKQKKDEILQNTSDKITQEGMSTLKQEQNKELAILVRSQYPMSLLRTLIITEGYF